MEGQASSARLTSGYAPSGRSTRERWGGAGSTWPLPYATEDPAWSMQPPPVAHSASCRWRPPACRPPAPRTEPKTLPRGWPTRASPPWPRPGRPCAAAAAAAVARGARATQRAAPRCCDTSVKRVGGNAIFRVTTTPPTNMAKSALEEEDDEEEKQAASSEKDALGNKMQAQGDRSDQHDKEPQQDASGQQAPMPAKQQAR